MYLVIKNGDTKKSYQCTNTCNKPRVCISNSYIPLTNNIQSKPKCIINSMEIASYKSYTYTTDRGTITTGTTYLTRTETTGITYQTRASTYDTIYAVDKKTSVLGTTSAARGKVQWSAPRQPSMYYTSFSLFNYNSNYDFTILITTSVHFYDRNSGASDANDYHGILTTKTMYDGYANYTQYYFSGGSYEPLKGIRISTVDESSWLMLITKSGVISKTTGTTYQTRSSTYNTLYGTRVSTSGTSYGTKTTNKTLTSSSWG